tara:strand:+ start:25 stop:744 length:720 start_codon:yes stop_codon:yes gene_type:complete
MKQRVQKIISSAGVCSRRNAEFLVNEGRIKINGETALLGDKADPNQDKISLDGKYLCLKNKTKVILLNKPAGFITSCNDEFRRKTVLSLIPKDINQGLHPIGRLDKDSRGALLLTNNGELTLKLTHPRYCHSKTYKVWVKGKPSSDTINRWERGILLDEKKTIPAKVNLLATHPKKSLLKVIIKEGRNRQIRRIADELGHPVIDLQRIAIDEIKLNGLKEGEWRELINEEWEKYFNEKI